MERDKNFDEWLDEAYEPFVIGQLNFYASDILANCDPIAYRIAVNDWKDEEGIGECDTCGDDYDTSSRDGRCGECGNCAECCEHAKTCNCECGCEVPLDWGTCVDCGEGTHQNNKGLADYCEHAFSTDGENGICMFCGTDEIK